MKKAKVKTVQANGTWDSPNGMFYKFEYQMDDGQIVNAMHKTPDGNFKPNEDVEYEIRNAQYNSGKVSKPQEFQGGYQKPQGVNDSILYQVCLKGVMDYKIQHGHQYFTAQDINNLALEIAREAKANIEKL